jgi:hypothetical protein
MILKYLLRDGFDSWTNEIVTQTYCKSRRITPNEDQYISDGANSVAHYKKWGRIATCPTDRTV